MFLSPKVKYHLMNPVNDSSNLYYNYEGSYKANVPCKTNPSRKSFNKITLRLYVNEDGFVKNVHWQAFADPYCRATCSWVAQGLKDIHLNDLVNNIIPEKAVMDLDIKDPFYIKSSCVPVFQALINCFDYSNDLK